MKTYTHLLAALGLIASPAALAQTVKLNPSVANVSALKAGSGVDVFLKQGNTESLAIEAHGLKADEIVVTMNNGTLTLGVDRQGGNWSFGPLGKSRYVKAYLTVKNLSAISVSSGADVHGQSDFTVNDLTVNVSSGADLTMQVKARNLTVSVSSGADATLSGSAEKLTARSSEGADLHAQELVADVCYVEASGGADASIYGRKEMHLKATGGGDISYRGPGQVVSRKTSGGGDIDED